MTCTESTILAREQQFCLVCAILLAVLSALCRAEVFAVVFFLVCNVSVCDIVGAGSAVVSQ